MSNQLKFFLIIIATIAALVFFVFPHSKWERSLANPGFKTPDQQSLATPTPTATPKQYQFDASSDLGKELESVNPQVLDSDFE